MTKLLQLTDGTTTIDLLDVHGIYAKSWALAPTKYKNDGIFSDSPIAEGRQLVYKTFNTVPEVVELYVFGTDQDSAIAKIRNLQKLIEKANNYWSGIVQEPVYIIARANEETNTRYSLIHFARLEGFDDLYSPTFEVGMDVAQQLGKGMSALQFGFERGHWLALQPGQSESVNISSVQTWPYNIEWKYFSDSFDSASAAVSTKNALFKASNGYLYTLVEKSSVPEFAVWRSTDDAENWTKVHVVTTAGLGTNTLSQPFTEKPNGNILVLGPDFQVDEYNGVSWSTIKSAEGGPFYAAEAIYAIDNSVILSGVSFDAGEPIIHRSTNGGSSFSSIQELGEGGHIHEFLELTSGNLLVTINNFGVSSLNGASIWRSTNAGLSWVQVLTIASQDDLTSMIQLDDADNTILVLDRNADDDPVDNPRIFRSIDDGVSWSTTIVNSPTTAGSFLTKGPVTGQVFMFPADAASSTFFEIWRSDDSGLSWFKEFQGVNQILAGAVLADNNRVITNWHDGTNHTIFYREAPSNQGMGQESTAGEVYITNKQTVANITNIIVEDNSLSSFTEIFPITSFPQALFPSSPNNNDAVYFGVSVDVVNNGPFSSLVFDITEPWVVTSGGDTFTLTWQYYNGAWNALTVTDNTNLFRGSGIGSVHWKQPSDWTTTTINGVEGYFVRAIVAITGTISGTPKQNNRQVYSITRPYVEIDSNEISGDTTALAKFLAQVNSDKDGRSGSGPDLWSNRLIAGLRTYSRGNNFQSYINFSESQQTPGSSVTLGVNTTFASSLISQSGQHVIYNPGGVEALATRATITLAPGLARDYYGSFHVFLRGKQDTGSPGDITVQLNVVLGSGGLNFTTPVRTFNTNSSFELIDFGQINIASTTLLGNEFGNQTQLSILAGATSGTPNLILYDLILIPVDEWSADCIDKTNDNNSIIGRLSSVNRVLDVDSISNPKSIIRSLVRERVSNLVSSIYITISRGSAVFQADEKQRLWFLFAQSSATGANFSWLAPHEISHTVRCYKNERFLTLRGSA